MKHFDLNIDKILENWNLSHAIRELIANAVDESLLTNTRSPEIIRKDDSSWIIRDFGRGLKYQDLIQKENPEKLSNPSVIGNFGIGLKDALATFERKTCKVLIKSAYGDISLARISKHSFDDISTLHALVSSPSNPDMIGTECCLFGVSDKDVLEAKKMFLCFREESEIEETKYGSVHRSNSNVSSIYINGMKVAEEPNFLFSYNIVSLTSTIKKALNRERQNLGRSVYSERIKSILLNCKSQSIAKSLSDDLQKYSYGKSHEELKWLDVQEHAVKILNAEEKVVFVNSADLINHPNFIDEIKNDGYEIVTLPENLTKKIQDTTDVSGNKVTELNEFLKKREDSFEFKWVQETQLSNSELAIWKLRGKILTYLGGCPEIVKSIKISETMQENTFSNLKPVGLWHSDEQRIIIKRSQLQSLAHFSGTLLHEAVHARYDVSDVSRDFESHLTNLIGQLTEKLFSK